MESKVLDTVRRDLLHPDTIAEVERRFRKAIKRGPRKATNAAQVERLKGEIDNLVAAIASDRLQNSPALAHRLAEAEGKLANVNHGAHLPVGPRITPSPHRSGEYLVAEIGLETASLFAASGMPESLVAGAGFPYFRVQLELR